MELKITDIHWKAVVDDLSSQLIQTKLINSALTEQVNLLTIQLATETELAEPHEDGAPTATPEQTSSSGASKTKGTKKAK